MKVIEPGQNWKIAALRSSFHVHFLFGGKMKVEFLRLALEQARKAYDNDEIPVGAVIVKNGEVLSCAYNEKEKSKKVTAHAEILAIEQAEITVGNWRLDDCDIYVTLGPCPMCASAIKQARIKNVYSALNRDYNNNKIVSEIFSVVDINHEVSFVTNLMAEESELLLKSFFKKKREK